jgi:hypothetical protein
LVVALNVRLSDNSITGAKGMILEEIESSWGTTKLDLGKNR